MARSMQKSVASVNCFLSLISLTCWHFACDLYFALGCCHCLSTSWGMGEISGSVDWVQQKLMEDRNKKSKNKFKMLKRTMLKKTL